MTELLAEKCALLERENDELRERIRQFEEALTEAMPPIASLTATEHAAIAVILKHPQGATKDQIMHGLYALRNAPPETKIVDVLVCKARKKLSPMGIEIETIWGWGYRIPAEGRRMLDSLREALP